MLSIFSRCIGNRASNKRVAKEIHPPTSSSSSKINFFLNDEPMKPLSLITSKPVEINEIPSHLAPAKKSIYAKQSITEALLILNHANIITTNKLISALTDNRNHAEDIAIALIYLHKCDIPLTETNITDIADAGPRAWDVAVAVVWFAYNIDSNIHTMNALISALTEDKAGNASDSVQVLAVISCLIPLTKATMEAIARAKDSMHFLQVVLALKNEGVKLTRKDIIALAKTKDDSMNEVAEEIRSTMLMKNYKQKAKLIIQDYIRNSLIPPPVADKIPLAPAITTTQMKMTAM